MHVAQDAQDDNPYSAWSEQKRSMSNFTWMLQELKITPCGRLSRATYLRRTLLLNGLEWR